MNSLFRSFYRKTHLSGALFLVGVLASGAYLYTAVAESPVVGQSSEAASLQRAPQQGVITSFSPGIADILKMVDATLDADIIKAFIKNSSTPYDPTVSEIIALKEHGLSSEIITAMIERGGEVKAQTARARQSNAVPYAQPPYPNTAVPYAPSPAYDYDTAQPAYAGYPYPYPYPVYSYSYLYPGNCWGYNCGYPWSYCSSSLYFSFYRRHHGYFYPRNFGRARDFDHNFRSPIHDGRSFPIHNAGFQARGGFAMRSSPMQSRGGGFRVASASGGRTIRRGR
jgi:hypothetical protein